MSWLAERCPAAHGPEQANLRELTANGIFVRDIVAHVEARGVTSGGARLNAAHRNSIHNVKERPSHMLAQTRARSSRLA